MIVVMAGLPGTGKSTLARALAEETGGIVLNKDVLRADLFPKEFVEYSKEQDDFVQDLMLRTAEYLLARYPRLTVFFDGRTFSRRYQIERVIETAERLGTSWRIIECVCPEDVARRRIEQARRHPAKNRTFELYLKIRDEFEEITYPKLVVDTGGAMSLDGVREYIRSESIKEGLAADER
jgi:adenylylsulfate kinase